MNRPIILGLILFFVVFTAFVILIRHRQQQPVPKAEVVSNDLPQKPAPAPPPSEKRIDVKLFFNAKDSTLLKTEDRPVLYHETLRNQLLEVFQELLAGPQGDLQATIPEGTLLRDVFISKDGVVYVDFSSELASKHPGGTDGEINTVYSIVDTVTYNFPQLKRVQILIDDQEVESLKGHLDLGHPLAQDLSMVALRQPPTQTAETQSEKSS